MAKANREALNARIDGLVSARKAYPENPAEAVASIRRIARSILPLVDTEDSSLPDLIAQIEKSPVEDVLTPLELLISGLQELVRDSGEAESRILIIEDDPIMLRILEGVLKAPGRHLLLANSGHSARQMLEKGPVALIMLDLMLPDIDGRSLLISLRENAATARVPIFVLSAQQAQYTKTECFALGADDFFEKPFDPETLSAAISTGLQRSRELASHSAVDTLTGLPTRSRLQEAFDRLQAIRKRRPAALSLALLDLDGLKAINDHWGHLVGDHALKEAARVLTETVRRADLIVRWGGDEFVILFPETDQKGAEAAVEKALDRLSQLSIPGSKDNARPLGFSAGVVGVRLHENLEDSLRRADKALYSAKARGGRTVYICDLPSTSPRQSSPKGLSRK